MRRPILVPAATVLLALAAAGAGRAHASAVPAVTLRAGSTAAVLGEPNGGGIALDLTAAWPVARGVSFGPAVFAHDLGTSVVRLRDPNDRSDVGAGEGRHRWTYGGAWRAEAVRARTGWSPFATGSWGYYRLEDDHLGQDRRALSSTGWSLGAGLRHPVGGAGAIGASLHYHRLFNDQAGRYAIASIDWTWRP